MRKEYCIFEEIKKCNNCGQCDICDLNSNKKCNNCGKCLEMEGIDTKAIKIASVIEDEGDSQILQSLDLSYIDEDLELDETLDDECEDGEDTVEINDEYTTEIDVTNDNFGYDDEELEYIDDIDGLTDILDDEKKLREVTEEVFPGFYRVRKI